MLEPFIHSGIPRRLAVIVIGGDCDWRRTALEAHQTEHDLICCDIMASLLGRSSAARSPWTPEECGRFAASRDFALLAALADNRRLLKLAMMHTVQQALARGTGVRLQKLGTGHRSASRPAGTGRHRALR
jgi:hypothetical protein